MSGGGPLFLFLCGGLVCVCVCVWWWGNRLELGGDTDTWEGQEALCCVRACVWMGQKDRKKQVHREATHSLKPQRRL